MLSAIIERRGWRCMVVSDNGAEFTSKAILAWSGDLAVEWHRAGRADAERVRRELHWPAPGRVSQRAPVSAASMTRAG